MRIRTSPLLLLLIVIIAPAGARSAAAAAAAAAGGAGAEPQVVRLRTREPDGDHRSLLVRELARQAVLMAAREELGLPTRDEALREPFGRFAVGRSPLLDVAVAYEPFKQLEVKLLKADDAACWTHTFPLAAPQGSAERGIAEIATVLEPAVRTHIADALRQAGYEKTRRAPDAKAGPATPAPTPAPEIAVPAADPESELRQLTYFAQFRVLRDAHAAAESPESLGHLVRAYTNLGQLTQFHWHASHKAFKARALLYAQRMVAADPKGPVPLWHRAYARALTGLHAAALADLDAADALNNAAAAKTDAPPWVALLRPYCRYDIVRLGRIGDARPQLAGLASYLSFTCLEFGGSSAAMIEFAKAAQIQNPDCVRLINAICIAGGVRYLHRATLEFPEIFKSSLMQELPRMRGLPPDVTAALDAARDQWDAPATRAKVAAALAGAGETAADAAEPSWAVLGRLAEETYIVSAQRRVHFLAYQWGVGPEQTGAFATAAMQLVGTHPDAPVIRSYAYAGDPPRMLEQLNDYRPKDLELGMKAPIHLHLAAARGPVLERFAMPMHEQMARHVDATANDLQQVVAMYAAQAQPRAPGNVIPANLRPHVERLHEVSPHNPLHVSFLIEHEWDARAKDVPQWEQQHGDMPIISLALAIKYVSLNRFADAERMYRKYIERCPDYQGYTGLAHTFLARGDEARWLATLNEYLAKVEDYGLEHDNVRVRIAYHFMDKNDYATALPYAEQAAQSWAAWAMQCAARAHEGVGNLDAAEQWVRNVSQRYDGSGGDWYVFCRRTGHGDVDAAKHLAEQTLRHRRSRDEADDIGYRGVIRLLAGENDAALAEFRGGLDRHRDVFCGLHVASAAVAAGDAAGRDQALAATVAAADDAGDSGVSPAAVELARHLKQHFARTPDAPLDAAAIAGLAPDADPDDTLELCYFGARFLDARGQKDDATRLYRRAAALASDRVIHALCWVALRDRGIDPAPARRDAQPPPQSPPQSPPQQ